MAVLVTGGAGYIGGHMVLALLDKGEEVVIVDDLSTGFAWAIPPEAHFYKGDFGDEALLAQVFSQHKIDSVIHFAAKIVVPDSLSDPLGYYLNNTAKARNLLAVVRQAGIQNFIFSSTAAVYGETSVDQVSETHALSPVSPYGRSKLMVEWMLEDCARAYGLGYTVLRYFNVAGADPKGRYGQSTPNATHLIKVAVQVVLGKRRELEVFGTDYPTRDGTCIRDYIHVTDLVAAHYLALQHLRQGGENLICNCGYGRGSSVLEVVAAVKKVSGVDFPVRLSPRRAGDPAQIVANADKIRARLGWTPQHDRLEEIVTQALDWERRLHNRT